MKRRSCNTTDRLPPGFGGRLTLRRGFTLMEMLLVLTVMLVLAGVAYFSMSNAFGRRDIDTAVEEVRKELSRTRNYAVDSALMYQFLYEPGGRHYVVVPFEVDTDLDAPDGSATQSLAQRYPTVSRMLPEGFQFEVKQVESSSGGQPVEPIYVEVPKDFAQLLHNSADVSKLGAKFLPIVFLPDGSADPASLIVKDDKQRSVTLTVRELTGTVSVSKMTQERR